MKRCPKCEFIYEDEQSLCDMDGVLLVLDSRNLPNLHALQTVRSVKTSTKRNRTVPAFATVILALVLGMVYYVSTQRRAIEDDLIPRQPIALSLWKPVPSVSPTALAQPFAEETKPQPSKPTPAASVPLPPKKATAKPAATPMKAKAEEKKDDSRVGNLLRKTGRILKKPFKL
ncbi:MAG TPA: hypothetical protein VN659_10205 [Pyrinomonadaceae bacterium]|nr:hypothetical protein [Pyrinomonadaceae bacterium]